MTADKDKKGVTVAQTENLRAMANAKGVTRELFQKALDNGRFADFLDSLRDFVVVNVNGGRLEPYRVGAERAHDYEKQKGATTLVLAEFLREGEESINFDGDVLFRRLGLIFVGERCAKALLAEKDRIPNEWRQYKLVFPANGWRAEFGRIRVPCLRWYQDTRRQEWQLDFVDIRDDFDKTFRVVVERKK